MKINYRKAVRELYLYKGRTVLALLGILIGIGSIGFVLTAYAILVREMNVDFMSTNPASVVLKVRNLDAAAVELVQKTGGDVTVEARKTLIARIDRGNGTFGTVYVFAVADFNRLKVDTFRLENGAFPGQAGQMALERDSLHNLPNLKRGYGEPVRVMLPGGTLTPLTLSGKVHAPGLAPASMEKYSYGYMTLEGVRALGYAGWYDEVHVVSGSNRFDRDAMRELASKVKDALRENGYVVERVDVPVPGRHPHGDQLKSLLFMLQAFTVISLVAACIIIVNLLSFIVSRQTRQIAVMKACGASTQDLVLPYLMYVVLIGVGALALSLPLSLRAGAGYAQFAANILNFRISSYGVPYWVFGIQALSAILIPVAASFYPIYQSCRITVKEGLAADHGAAASTEAPLRRMLPAFREPNAQTAIPVNNLLRKKGRTLLAVLALAAGGVLFMSAQNIVASIERTVDASMETFRYDLDVRLQGNTADATVLGALAGVEGIERAEICRLGTASFRKPDGTDSGTYRIKVLPRDSTMVKFSLLAGAGIQNSENGVVINKGLLDEEPWLRPGMSVRMAVNGVQRPVQITGIVNEVPPLPGIYMSRDSFEKRFSGLSGQNLLISLRKLSPAKQAEVSRAIEERFGAAGIEITENWNIGLLRRAFVEHLNVIVNFLSVVALLAVAVGGLSIASAIGIGITERRRELGVLRAVGVTSMQTVKLISLEVLLMGVGGWLAGLLLSLPVSAVAGDYFGQIFLHAPLNTAVSVTGALIWLAISVAVALVSGLVPALEAGRAPLGDMLAYE